MKILQVDLTTGSTSTDRIAEKEQQLFLGGRGLGAFLLYQELKPLVDPLGPENKLIFVNGPLGGTKAPGSSKFVVVTKSPLTGIYLMSISSRGFGSFLKKAGYDVLIIQGEAKEPVYLLIHDQEVKLVKAAHLMGLTTTETEEVLKREYKDKDLQVASIGPAGENLVLYSSIINAKRACGRGGAGAVMGSKNLKAIAIKGTGSIKIAHPHAFSQTIKDIYLKLNESPRTKNFRLNGTVASIEGCNSLGILPVRNWQQAYWDEAEGLSATMMREKYLLGSTKCVPCLSHCSKITQVKEGPYRGTITEGPEYETLYSFGSCCGISDFGTVIKCDYLCDEYGLDTMSAGVSIAFVMECFEKGLLSKDDTQGLDFSFGDHKDFPEILKKIAYQEGFGAFLAKGTKRMAKEIGQNSEDFAMHVKGMELGAYDPRTVKGMAMVFACGSRGGCHHAGGRTLPEELDTKKYDRFADTGKALLVKKSRDERVVLDSAVICSFSSPGLEGVARMLEGATGIDYGGVKGLLELGDRISNMERLFNCREGLGRAHDTLPGRLLKEVVNGGRSSVVDIETMLDEFYQACGWDIETGIPNRDKLEEVGLDYLL